MPGLDILMQMVKKQKGKHYRLVHLDSGNVTAKKLKGYEFVRGSDPEVVGTVLARDHKGPDGIIRMGNLGLARTSEEQYQKNRAKVRERTDRKLRALKRSYQEAGENIKRKLGSHHRDFKIIHREED